LNRVKKFAKNKLLEDLLKELENDFSPAEAMLVEQYKNKEFTHPLILIVGPMRSGTTLFMQWLASLKMFAYPTNFLSRFYYAPIIGSKIQKLLTDTNYSFGNELFDINCDVKFSSENGKTVGAMSPNEFWYFWNRFIDYKELDYLDHECLLKDVDCIGLNAELAGVIDVFKKPLALKAMKYNHNVPFLNCMFKKVIFVRMKREYSSNVQSIIDARIRQFGNIEAWYSLKVPEYEKLKLLSPFEQAAGQVLSINRSLDSSMKDISPSQVIDVCYEDFCANPEKIYIELLKKMNQWGGDYLEEYSGEEKFETKPNTTVIDPKIKKALIDVSSILKS
jgi:hypothetical protein